MNPNTGRSSIFAVVGGYLIYMAYELLKNLIDNVPTTMPRFLQILFIVLFAVIGLFLLISAWKLWKQGREDRDKNPVELEGKEEGAADGEDGPIK